VSAGPFPDLDAAARRSSDFEILGHQLEFEGLCADCRKSAKRRRKRPR
jgi:Fe2+ or Zn2+ uptake regulation protein